MLVTVQPQHSSCTKRTAPALDVGHPPNGYRTDFRRLDPTDLRRALREALRGELLGVCVDGGGEAGATPPALLVPELLALLEALLSSEGLEEEEEEEEEAPVLSCAMCPS